MKKKNARKELYLFLIPLLSLYGCRDNGSEKSEQLQTEVADSVPAKNVTVFELKKSDFNHEIISNGKIAAKKYADLFFRINTEPVTGIFVKNGDCVRKGQKLAQLDVFTLDSKVRHAKNSMDKAFLTFQDILVGQGFSPDINDSIPENVLNLAKVKSGYEGYRIEYYTACHELEKAELKAPFDGVVANLSIPEYNLPQATVPFCRIISLADMCVRFQVLESELSLINKGDEVEVEPYFGGGKSYSGKIVEINPLVDKNGMVEVTANVSNAGKLFDGMNVRVRIKRSLPGQFVVPKTALVVRNGKQVVFTVQNYKANWNYVQTEFENLTEYTITGENLHEGMFVVTGGNVNLAHDTDVKIVERLK